MKSLPDSPLSLWLDTFGTYTPAPSLKGNVKTDVAVIGGGVIVTSKWWWCHRAVNLSF